MRSSVSAQKFELVQIIYAWGLSRLLACPTAQLACSVSGGVHLLQSPVQAACQGRCIGMADNSRHTSYTDIDAVAQSTDVSEDL